MTDELTPSLAGDTVDTDEDKTERPSLAAKRIAEALQPLLDGKVILAVDIMIIVKHPDGKVGCTHQNIGTSEKTKEWAARQAWRFHSGELAEPDARESFAYRVPEKH